MAKKNKQDENLTEAQIVVHKYPSFFDWTGRMGLSIADNKYINWFLLLLLVILTFLLFQQSSGGDYDFFFHLKYGEIYLKNLTWKLDHSMFSWTPSWAEWPYVTWIGNILIYLFYNIASGNGVLLLQWLVFLGTFFMYWYYVRTGVERFDTTNILLVLLTMSALALIDIFIKPDLFTTFFFGAVFFIYIYAKTSSKNLFYLYPVIFLVWANTHGGFTVGLMFITIAFFGELINYFFFKKSALPKKILYIFLIAVAASYLVGLINPYGYGYYSYLAKGFFSKEAYESFARPLIAYISLWGHVFSIESYKFTNGAWVCVFFGLVLIILFLYGIFKRKRFDASLFIVALFFFFFSMSMARAVKFFPIVAVFGISYMIKTLQLEDIKKKLALFALVIFLSWSGRLMYQTIVYTGEGLSLSSWDYSTLVADTPQDVVEYVNKFKFQGPIFNDYFVGGYLLWKLYPDYKVFIDPRQTLYAEQVWPDFQQYANSLPLTHEKLKAFAAKYPFKIAIIHYQYFPLIEVFLTSGDWKLLFFDRVSALIIHKSLVPTITLEAQAVEAGTVRFVKLARPNALMNLFRFYIFVGPSFARDIIEIYRRNVSNLYRFKEENIRAMEQALQQRVMQIQQEQATKKKVK